MPSSSGGTAASPSSGVCIATESGRAIEREIEQLRRMDIPLFQAEPGAAEQVICATGFRRGLEHDPLLRRLVEEQRQRQDVGPLGPRP